MTSPAFVETLHGPFLAYPDDLITRQLTRFGSHAGGELALILDAVSPDDVVIDIGAHIGTFAVPLCRAVGANGRVVCFEPNQDSFALLELNLELNGLAGMCTMRQLGVGPAANWKLANETEGNSGATFLQPTGDEGSIRTIEVDQWLHNEMIDRVDFIKIDTEGMEVAVLSTMEKTLSVSAPLLYIEIGAENLERFDASPALIDEKLTAHEYRLFRNVGRRHTKSRMYELVEIHDLVSDDLFDVLAVPPSRVDILDRLGIGTSR